MPDTPAAVHRTRRQTHPGTAPAAAPGAPRPNARARVRKAPSDLQASYTDYLWAARGHSLVIMPPHAVNLADIAE